MLGMLLACLADQTFWVRAARFNWEELLLAVWHMSAKLQAQQHEHLLSGLQSCREHRVLDHTKVSAGFPELSHAGCLGRERDTAPLDGGTAERANCKSRSSRLPPALRFGAEPGLGPKEELSSCYC